MGYLPLFFAKGMDEIMLTFDRDHTLPPLPVPELGDSCWYLKKMIKPLTDAETFAEASNALDMLYSDQGVSLHELLLRHVDSGALNSSWLSPIWDDVYLSYRGMLPINMNYAFQFVKGWWGDDELSVLISALSRAIGKMRTEGLPVEFNRDGYLSMYNSAHAVYTRIPGKHRDIRYYMPLSGQMTASVLCNELWFILTLTDMEGNYLPAASVANALSSIRERAEAGVPSPPVGALTCTDRESAAELRDLLQAFPGNRLNLERIEKSAFTICLDDPPGSKEDFSLRLLTGKPGNRWFDKSIQIISDGDDLGANFEHSGCDAGIMVYLLNQAGSLRDAAQSPRVGDAHVLPLSWDIPDDLAQKLEDAADQFRAASSKMSSMRRKIEDVSRDRIRALKCSPDAFVQLLYQAAYYSITGSFASVYEAVSTRKFYQGRTDCARPVSEESAEFVRALALGGDKAALSEKFYSVVRVIGDNMKRAQQALGPERHMAGLSMMAQTNGIPMPDIFSAEGYKKLRRDTLSTSSTTAPFIEFFSFGPVASDGFGIGYGIKEDALHLSVSAYDDSAASPERFLDEVERAAGEFYKILT